jgi:hypothetical protein
MSIIRSYIFVTPTIPEVPGGAEEALIVKHP